MQPHKFMIGIAMVSLFITAGLYVMFGTASDNKDSLFDNYSDISTNIQEINRSKFSKWEEDGEASQEAIYNLTKDQKEEMLAQDVEEELGWEVLIVGPYRMIQRLPTYFRIIGIMINDIAKILHLPPIFVDFAVFVVLVIIVTMIVYLLMRFQPRDD